MKVPATMPELEAMFEQYERGSTQNLRHFLSEAEYKYTVGINEFVYKPGNSIMEFADVRVIKSLFRLQMFQSMAKHVRKLFKNPKIISLLEFPVLFLGATPQNTPALYSLMNYADMSLGTWYPMGGMHKIVEGMVSLAKEKGVKLLLNEEVTRLETSSNHITRVHTKNNIYETDILVGGADYHHVEQELLPAEKRQYSEKYWQKRTMAPSSIVFYLGINKRLDNLWHHNLFFDENFEVHAKEIYETPQFPSKPLFYVSCPSKTDATVAPEGCENLFILIPTAPNLTDTDAIKEQYYQMVMERLEKITKQNIRDAVVYKRAYAHSDFQKDYHAFKGNAYGLANTLLQTAFFKPKMRSNRLKNLFYTGQLTTPGPGVPPSLISGEVVANEIYKNIQP
jgi:phytoene desaturase